MVNVQKPLMNKQKSRLNIILNAIPFLLALLVFIGVKLSISNPGGVEEYYSRGIYPVIAGFISMVSGLVSYSLWDLFWAGLSLFVLAGLILVILKRLSIARYLLRFTQMLAMFYSLFYLTWGFNYFRPALETRLGWDAIKPDDGTFRTVLDSLIVRSNETYTSIEPENYPHLDAAVEKSYSRCSDLLAISYPNGTRPTKTILISSYFAKSGVSGYFGPFFNEVHINHYQLAVDYPFITAHEKAHQFGFANEAEANLAAFIVCSTSEDRRLQYSGYMHLLLYFLNNARHLPEYRDYLSKIDKRVMKDLMHREKYYDGLRNKKLEKVQTAANDVYLKTQNIEKGIKNYDQVVALAIAWYTVSGKLPLSAGEGFADLSEKQEQ